MLLEYQVGQIVYSKSGHDQGDAMVVLSVEDVYVILADGKRRTLAKPKRKKIIHVQPTKFVDVALADKLNLDAYVLDADIKKAIQSFQNKEIQ